MVKPWILIPNHNGRHWLVDCLETLRATVPADIPIVVVDNDSRDGSIEFLATEHPDVQRIELSRNLGFVQAINLAILLARRNQADSVLLLNNDTRFEQGWFESLRCAAVASPQIGIFGVAQFDFGGRPSGRTRVEFERARNRGQDDALPDLIETDWVEGSCMLIRDWVFESIGYLDPIFAPAYFEEMDFCRRAVGRGIPVALVPAAKIRHHGAGTSLPNRRRLLRSQAERKRRILSERNYLIYHASGSTRARPLRILIGRGLRHGAKQMLRGQLGPLEWLSAFGNALASAEQIRCKRLRDTQGRACPLPGSGLRGGSKHTHYLDWITLMDAAPAQDLEPDPNDANESVRASVVIPVRDRTEDLEACLIRVLAQTLDHGDFEVLVCDDGSQAEAARRIQAICCRDTRVRYLRQEPRGPAAARNLGVAYARSEFVVFTDSDTLAEPGWLNAILAPFREKAVVAVEGPVRTPRPPISALEEAPRNEGGVHLTANMAYRRQTLVQVGGLDERFTMPAFEDVDLALCTSHFGKIAFAPSAVVIHPWRKVTLASSLRRLRNFDWLILTAQRHGCLGWRDRPTNHPRLRVIRAALLTLPIGRIRKSIALMPLAPKDSAQRIAITLAETVAALVFHLPRWIRTSHAPVRRRYLHGTLQ